MLSPVDIDGASVFFYFFYVWDVGRYGRALLFLFLGGRWAAVGTPLVFLTRGFR